MQNDTRIAIHEFCIHHNIEPDFIVALRQSGLIETETDNDVIFVQYEQLPALEKFIRFRYDMDINLEGIETINYLLLKIEKMQAEMRSLREQISVSRN